MIWYCENCEKYWDDRTSYGLGVLVWYYVTLNGTPIKSCPNCEVSGN